MGFSEAELGSVMNAMPDMVCFSPISGDAAVLELAMELLSAEDLEVVFLLMEKGGRLKAAQSTAGIAEAIALGKRMNEVTKRLRVEFFRVSDFFRSRKK